MQDFKSIQCALAGMTIILVWHVEKFEQPPSTDVVTVSSGSDSSPVNNPKRSAHAKHDPKGRKSEQYSIKIDNGEESLLIKTEEPTDAKQEPKGRKNERDSIKINIGEESLLIKTVEPTDAKHENNQILSQGKIYIYAPSKWNIA